MGSGVKVLDFLNFVPNVGGGAPILVQFDTDQSSFIALAIKGE